MTSFSASNLHTDDINSTSSLLQICNLGAKLVLGQQNSVVEVKGSLTVNSGSEARFSFPQEQGGENQFLQTDGNGNTSWAAVEAGSVIVAPDHSCSIECFSGEKVVVKTTTATVLSSDPGQNETVLRSPAGTGELTVQNDNSVIMGGYTMPNSPGSLGQVLMADNYNYVSWQLPVSSMLQFGGAGNSGFLALNGLPTQPTSPNAGIGYRFLVPDNFVITKIAYDANFVSGTKLNLATSYENHEITLNSTTPSFNLNLFVVAPEVVTVSIISGGEISESIVTVLLSWYLNLG